MKMVRKYILLLKNKNFFDIFYKICYNNIVRKKRKEVKTYENSRNY
jgi:hypothetical protein